MTETGPSAKAASLLIDLRGVESFADEALAYVESNLNPLTPEQRALVKAGAIKAAMLVADEIRDFAEFR